MKTDFIERFDREVSKEDFWSLNKRIGAVVVAIVLAVLLFNTTGCTQNKTAEVTEDIVVEELPQETVNVGDDGISAAIAPDNAQKEEAVDVQVSNGGAMVTMSLEDTGRDDPFLPEGEKLISYTAPKAKINYDLLPPPEMISIDTTATEVITTKVSGIMYDNYNPSAILNIQGSDYLVRSGDIVNGYKVLAIARDNVTVQNGANVYKAGVGELLPSGGINYNTVSNLEGKFGGSKNVVRK